MTELSEGSKPPNTVEYLNEIQKPLPAEVLFGQGRLLFTPSRDMTIKDGSKSGEFPSYRCLFISNQSGQKADFSRPLIKKPGFRILYLGSSDKYFTMPPGYVVDAKQNQVIGFDPNWFLRQKYGLPHEQGHAYLNWEGLTLKVIQAAHTNQHDTLPNYPEIRRYAEYIASITNMKTLPFPKTEQDLIALTQKHKTIKKGLELFEERYGWGVGLALVTLYPGFSNDWLVRDGLEQAERALVTYAIDHDEPLFNNGFARNDDVGNLAYFFEQQFK